MGTSLEDRPRHAPSTTIEKFPSAQVVRTSDIPADACADWRAGTLTDDEILARLSALNRTRDAR
jgi:hypothetical protein